MKTKNKKKVAKKVVGKQKHTSQELVIRVQPMPVVPTTSDLSEPMMKGKKLTIPKTWLSEGQLLKIVGNTPREHVYQRPGKGGGKFDYVTTSYITKVLNYTFGWNWDFEVVEHGTEGGQVWVKGKLTVRGNRDGQQIVKTQFGRADIKYKKDTKLMLDFGNDLKGATSDALKKCASMLGIASDIYGKGDYKQESGKDPKEPISPVFPIPKSEESQEVVFKEGQVPDADGHPVYLCEKGDEPISDEVAAYSKKMFGKRLCREHQPNKK